MAFMRPEVHYFSANEAQEYVAEQYGVEEVDSESFTDGYYARLSASGYLDCTEFIGPYNTPEEALSDLMDLFNVDEEGNYVGE
jgi:hypothetical protein